MTPITAVFAPLTDSAVLVAAQRLGLAAEEGVDLQLVRERSWATVRDRLVYGQVQVAHILAPLAVAVTLGLGHRAVPLAAPFKLGMNGSAITLSSALAAALDPIARNRIDDPVATAHDLAAAIGLHRRKPIFGIVHRYSSHALTLRYWLAYAGIDPARHIQMRVLPPSGMVEALAAGEIDGFTVGEPWNSVAVDRGLGEIVGISSNIWRRSVDKVLAMREDWAEANPETADRLLRALDRAATWCEDPANGPALASMLADEEVLGERTDLIERALAGRLMLSPGGEFVEAPDFFIFHREAANFPWRSQALWIYSQLVRWGLAEASESNRDRAARLFRTDIYRRALTGGATPLPGASLKVEGALAVPTGAGSDRGTLSLGPDGFFDGRVFDPLDIGAYLESFHE